MLRKNKLNLIPNSKKISLPLILPSISSKFKTISNSNTINHQDLSGLNPKTFEKRKKFPKKLNIHKTLFSDGELVRNLDIDINPNLIMAKEAELKKMKENIDSNPDIELKRMGKYKAKQTTDENDIESKEKVKILEKKYNDDLSEYKNIKQEKEKLGEHILNLINIIEDYKLELYTFTNYTNELYKQFLEKKEDKKTEIINKMKKLSYDRIDEYNSLDEELHKLNTNDRFDFIEEIKIKKINVTENLMKAEELLKKLQEKKLGMNDKTKELKNKIKENKINLIKLYHISLYEGLDFRYEGLSSVIRAIWNLGVEVDVKYMPKYLDKILINFLFEHAKLVIEMNNWRKQLEISKEKFIKGLEEWKKDNIVDNYKLNSQRSSNNNSDVDIFKTKLDDKDKKIFARSDKFMKNYYNKYSHLIDNKEKNELNEYRQSRLENRIALPKKFIEQYKLIEKGNIIIQKMHNKMRNMEKNEIVRLCREFSFNNYGNMYKVCPYIIVSAICGNEYREEGMMFYNMTEREINDNKKMIRFFEINKIKINS